MDNLNIIILAAGRGQRMRRSLPKVLHALGGVPMLERVVNTARQLNPKSIYVVYGNGGEEVRHAMAHLPVEWVEQKETLGTGHAVLQVMPHIDPSDQVLVLFGDVPLISKATLEALLASELKSGVNLVVAEFEEPSGFGRIIRNELGNILAIVEERDATESQKAIQEINTGILTTQASYLKHWLPRLANDKNAQGEYYLTDIVAMAVAEGHPVGGILADCNEEVRGVNNLIQLTRLERYFQKQQAHHWLLKGVQIVDPQRIDIRGRFEASNDVFIDVNVVFEGEVSLGAGCQIGAHCVLRNVRLGNNVIVKPYSLLENALIGDECVVGPYARLRPGTILHNEVHVGNFVEIKKSELGRGTKVNHLSYIGDATIGERVNVGAGTITCNYDGVHKHQTVIKDDAFIGSNSALVAPVTVGRGATIGAGSTITEDADSEKLTLARPRQETILNWKRPEIE